MTDRELMQHMLEVLNRNDYPGWQLNIPIVIALRKRLAQPEQEPVAWLITDEKINSLQVDSIQRLIDRARHAHMTDIKLRINGQDEWHQADWLKYLTRTTPPQRKPLTDEEIETYRHMIDWTASWSYINFARAIESAHGIKGEA